ncbi:MAG: S9 family peptidase [Pseudomonadota bacterium]
MIRVYYDLTARILACLLAVAATTGACLPSSAFAQDSEIAGNPSSIPPLISTEAFAGRAGFWNARLAPDGNTLTILQRAEGRLQLTVIDPRTRTPINAINFGKGTFLEWYRWIDNERMLINAQGIGFVFGTIVPTSTMYIAYPREGRATPLVDDQKAFDGGDLIHVAKDKKSVLIAQQPPGSKGTTRRKLMGRLFNSEPAVYRYELKPGGAVTPVLKPKKGVDYWITDDDGVIRLGMGWRRKKLSIFYRDASGAEFERIARLKSGDTEGFFDAIQILSNSSEGYVLDENDEGRVGLRVFDYKTREIVDTYYENPDWDVDDVWFKKDGTPLAVVYTDDRQRTVWFDKDYEKTHKRLTKALGGMDVLVVSRSEDDRQMLVSAGNEADPGVLYFYDRDTGALNEFAQYRPELDFRHLAQPKPISYTARDGTDIRAYLTLPKGRDPSNLPLIIHPHGGPFGIRDELRYDDHVQFLANRGYAVLQPNFRGSGGYGTAFYDLGAGEVGRGMQNDLDDAMDWAVAEGIADPARVCIVGGSYGGYAALWGVLRNPERYACAASWAGVTDWTRMLQYDRRVMTRQAGKRWSAKIEGDDEAIDLKDYSPYRLAKGLSRPVLLGHGTRDDNVPFKQYEQMVRAAKKAPAKLTTLVIKGEGHGFSKADSEQKWFDALDAFLAKHNPADQVDGAGNLKPGANAGSKDASPDAE